MQNSLSKLIIFLLLIFSGSRHQLTNTQDIGNTEDHDIYTKSIRTETNNNLVRLSVS